MVITLYIYSVHEWMKNYHSSIWRVITAKKEILCWSWMGILYPIDDEEDSEEIAEWEIPDFTFINIFSVFIIDQVQIL